MPPQAEEPTPTKLALESISASIIDAAPEDADDCTTEEQFLLLKHKAELESFRQDTGERKKYAKKIFSLTCLWVVGIYVLLLFEGFAYRGFKLSESVMLAAIGSTTANIIGVFLIVTRYFFPKKHY